MKVIPALMLTGLVCSAQVGSANAYFTTYVTAKGGYTVSWEHHEEIHEEYENWNKLITISSKEGSIPVFVRVKAYGPDKYPLVYTGGDWTDGGDGWYYYSSPLAGGKTTSGLNIAINDVKVATNAAQVQDGENFNVIVVYESIPATYDESGNPIAAQNADWSQTLTSTSESQTGELTPTEPSDSSTGEEAVE